MPKQERLLEDPNTFSANRPRDDYPPLQEILCAPTEALFWNPLRTSQTSRVRASRPLTIIASFNLRLLPQDFSRPGVPEISPGVVKPLLNVEHFETGSVGIHT